jgi:hypothetical protein
MENQTKLPAVIEMFINASNEHNGDKYISTFADDALVNDVARNFWGKDEIRNWADKEIIEPKRCCDSEIIISEIIIVSLPLPLNYL